LPPARQGDGSAGLARAACLVVSPALVAWPPGAQDVAGVVVRAMGPQPEWAETGPLAFGERQRPGSGARPVVGSGYVIVSTRARARPRPPLGPRGAQLEPVEHQCTVGLSTSGILE
jgi:hypothetical protein